MATQTASRVVQSLTHQLANSVTLYLNAKRYHWFTYGPLFRDIHLLFDEIAAVARDSIDPIGERIRILGGDPISTPDEIRSAVTVTVATGKTNVSEMLQEALRNERHVISEMREAIKVAEDEHDYGTVDLYSGILQEHEKYAWFLEAMSARGDGIVS